MKPDGVALITWRDATDKVIGTAEVYCAALAEATGRRPGYWPSRTYVCPECGQQWMREHWDHKYQYRSGAGPAWQVVTAPCRWHGGGYLLDRIPLEACDAQILKRELNLYFRVYDNEHIASNPIPELNFERDAGSALPNPAGSEGPARGPDRHGEDYSPGHSS